MRILALALLLIMCASLGAQAACTTIPNTSTKVGQGCFTPNQCPAATNGHDPINFGADSTGATDSEAAINSAAAAGTDIVFGTAGTYLVDYSHLGGIATNHGLVPATNVKVLCTPQNGDGSPAVHLKFTGTNGTSDVAEWSFDNGNNFLCGCDLVGNNTGSPPLNIIGATGNVLVRTANAAGSGTTIEGNTFERNMGDAAIQANSGSPSQLGPSNITVEFNTFSLIPLYATNVDSQVTNFQDHNNLITDGNDGLEWDTCGVGSIRTIGTGTIQNNMLTTTTAGNCRAFSTNCDQPEFIGEATSQTNSCDYSGFTLSTNYCAGCPVNAQGQCVGSGVAAAFRGGTGGAGGTPAVFSSNNYLGTTGGADNCSCTNGLVGCGTPGPAAPNNPISNKNNFGFMF